MNKSVFKFLATLFLLNFVEISLAQVNSNITQRLKQKYQYVLNEKFGFIVVKNEKYGFCDSKGKEITPPIWDAIVQEDNCLTSVFNGKIGKPGTKQGLIDEKGKFLIPCEYDYIRTGYGKKVAVYIVEKDGLYGMIDKEGRLRLKCEYDHIESYYAEHGVLIVAKNRSKEITGKPNNPKYALATTSGTFLTPFDYDWIGEFHEDLFVCNKGGKMEFRGGYPKGGKYGYMDIHGKEIIACQYDNRCPFKDGVAQVTKDGVTSLLEHPLQGTNLRMTNGGGVSVDANIPSTGKNNENTFAFIIANENYAHFTGADYSINDGKVFADYCKKTLGLPEKNVRYYEDATFGNITNAVKKLQDIADVYEGDAKIIFYYSGLGATADKSMEKYLLATDASMTALENTGYSVNTLLKTINNLNVEYSWVVLDTPFSNLDKSGKPLASGRGVAVKSKPAHAEGKTIVTMSSSGEQTAYSSKKFGHSLLTYGLLEKLQQTRGACSIKELNDYATSWVKKNAMAEFDKMQTPSCTASDAITNQLNNIKF